MLGLRQFNQYLLRGKVFLFNSFVSKRMPGLRWLSNYLLRGKDLLFYRVLLVNECLVSDSLTNICQDFI